MFLQNVKLWPAFLLLSPCHRFSECDISPSVVTCDMWHVTSVIVTCDISHSVVTCDIMWHVLWHVTRLRCDGSQWRQLLFRKFRDMARLLVYYCLHTKISFKQTNIPVEYLTFVTSCFTLKRTKITYSRLPMPLRCEVLNFLLSTWHSGILHIWSFLFFIVVLQERL